jgi:hypothetical protein
MTASTFGPGNGLYRTIMVCTVLFSAEVEEIGAVVSRLESQPLTSRILLIDQTQARFKASLWMSIFHFVLHNT